jgi:hypothetical protein
MPGAPMPGGVGGPGAAPYSQPGYPAYPGAMAGGTLIDAHVFRVEILTASSQQELAGLHAAVIELNCSPWPR